MKLYAACQDCSNSNFNDIKEGNYCRMFTSVPPVLPCGQHDKYREARQATGRLILKNPILLTAFVMGALLNEGRRSSDEV